MVKDRVAVRIDRTIYEVYRNVLEEFNVNVPVSSLINDVLLEATYDIPMLTFILSFFYGLEVNYAHRVAKEIADRLAELHFLATKAYYAKKEEKEE